MDEILKFVLMGLLGVVAGSLFSIAVGVNIIARRCYNHPVFRGRI